MACPRAFTTSLAHHIGGESRQGPRPHLQQADLPKATRLTPKGVACLLVPSVFFNHSFCFSAAALRDLGNPNRAAPQPKNKKK